MQTVLMTGFYIALVALLVVLGFGIANIARSDDKQASRSNKLMRLRILVQAVVIVILVALGVTVGAIKIGF
jgi:heme/copper-type cytochrome/quinol oxidase subunit 2